jgi:hypothetical protein
MSSNSPTDHSMSFIGDRGDCEADEDVHDTLLSMFGGIGDRSDSEADEDGIGDRGDSEADEDLQGTLFSMFGGIEDRSDSEADEDVQGIRLSMHPGGVILEDVDEDEKGELHFTRSIIPSNVIKAADDIEGGEEMHGRPHSVSSDIGDIGDSKADQDVQATLLSVFANNFDSDDSDESDNESITEEEWQELEENLTDVFDGEFAI